MTDRPTYEELEKRVHELESRVSQLTAIEESLRESEWTSRSILRLAPDPISVSRISDGRYMRVNEAFCQHTGYSAEEIVGRTALELGLYADPADRQRLLESLERHGQIEALEIPFRIRNGTVVEDNLVSARAIRFKGEDCLLAISKNITPLAKAQRALRESEERYRNILETIEEGYYEVDLGGNFTLFNDALCRLYGYSRDALMRMNYRQYLSPEEAKRVYRILNEVFKTGVPAKLFDHEVIGKDGSKKIIEISSALRRNVSGEPIGFHGVARDVTGKVNALKALRESEETYRSILALAPDAIVVTRVEDGRYLQFNEAFCQNMGYRSEEVLGRTVFDLNVYVDTADRNRVLEAVRRDGQVVGLEAKFRRRDGGIIDALISARPMRFQGEDCLLSVIANVTSLKAVQNALRESEESYRSILALAPDSIVVTRVEDGRYLQANEAFCQRLGYEPEEVLGRTVSDLNLYVDTADRKRVLEAVRRDGRVDGFEVKIRRKDGTIEHELMSARIIRFQGEECMLVVATNITSLKAVQNALRESEESYRSILALAPEAIVIVRAKDGRYVQVNDAFCQMTGYSPEEAIGRTGLDLNIYPYPAERDGLLEAFRRDGRLDGLEVRFQSKDGTIMDDLVSARPIRFKGEDCVLIMATVITPLKEAQRALRESEEKYRNILETMEEGYYENDLAGNFTFCNETVLKFFGFSREEFIGTNYRNYMSAETSKRLEASFREIFKTGLPAEIIDYEVTAKDGSKRSIELSASLRRNASGDPVGFRGITRDMTQRRKAEMALRESEARFRTIFETASDPIFLYEMGEGRFLDVNRAGCKHLGYTKEELLHMSIRGVVDSDEALTLSERLSQVARNRYCFYESLFVRKDGTKVPVEVSSGIVEQEGKEVVLSIIRDITERRRSEAELAKYREHLEERVLERTQALEAAQMELVKQEKLAVLGQLTATVSHELRNPLGVIRSSNFYLQRKVNPEDEKLIKHFNRIEEQVGRCDGIVGELLEYSRGRRVEAVDAEIDLWLDPLLDELVESEKIKIMKGSSPRLPPIPHDREKMRRVLINVFDNAIQAVKAKQAAWDDRNMVYYPEIHVMTRADEDDIILEIADNGIGMDENTRERAFEPLFTTRAKGTGIGLANVHKIVTEHGGSVTLDSHLESGTTVTIKLPRRVGPEGESTKQKAR